MSECMKQVFFFLLVLVITPLCPSFLPSFPALLYGVGGYSAQPSFLPPLPWPLPPSLLPYSLSYLNKGQNPATTMQDAEDEGQGTAACVYMCVSVGKG